MPKKTATRPHHPQAVIVDGLRSPFVRSSGAFQAWSSVDLAQRVAVRLLQKSGFPKQQLDQVILGSVLTNLQASNPAREVILGSDIPLSVPGLTVSQACASGAAAVILAAQAIRSGDCRAALVGGVESMSNVPLPHSKGLVDTLMAISKAKDLGAKLKLLTRLHPRELLPRAPKILEASTGKTMGQHAEAMAQSHGISRQEQDAWSADSHRKARYAWEQGWYKDEVCPLWPPPLYAPVVSDETIRSEEDLAKLPHLKPAFDTRYGSLTAGNSSGLSDGAALLLLCEESLASQLGYRPLAHLLAWHTAALPPEPELLAGPAYAIPAVLKKANLTLADIDLFDIHEAFAAQVLCVLKKLACPHFARQIHWGEQAVGQLDPQKINVKGGSIALGHPFGATGARMILSMARELQRRQARYALLSWCAAGGLGTALILERVEA